MKSRIFAALASLVLGLSSVNGMATDDNSDTVPPARLALFNQIGIGAAYGPHYPCYGSSGIIQCTGTPSDVQDAKNSYMESSVPLDMTQLRSAGFLSVRAYGDPAKVWIAMINRINQLNLANPGGPQQTVVYQVELCQTDPAQGQACTNVSGMTFQQVLAFSMIQLRQVIQQVTPKVFQKVVKLVIVGNEVLVLGNDNNISDLIGAIKTTSAELTKDGVPVSNGSNGGVYLSSATVIGQMIAAQGQMLAASYPPGSPVIEDVYPPQFSCVSPPQMGQQKPPICAPNSCNVTPPSDAVGFLRAEVNCMQATYACPGPMCRPAMIGETGWWTAGKDTGYQASWRVGTLADAVAYYKGLYAYLKTSSVPALIFEAYDQPIKGPTNGTLSTPEAEQNYGVISYNNQAKNTVLLPNPVNYKNPPNTSNAAVFSFVVTPPPSPLPAMTFGVQQPGETQPTKVTVQPFTQITNINGGTQIVWPSFNLYAPPTNGGNGSKMALYPTGNSCPSSCSNSVKSVYTLPQVLSCFTALPFSGGIWTAPGQGCTCTNYAYVNWGNGNSCTNGSPQYGQNVFLPSVFYSGGAPE
jgi:hypothetical protein